MSAIADEPSLAQLKVQPGSFRRFGEYGPVYEIVTINPDQTATIRVLESGEGFDYAIAKIMDDPEE